MVMKYLSIKLLITVVMFSFFMSCKKSSSSSKDTTPPSISFITPSTNTYYAAGDTVVIRGLITDENVSSASVEIRNKTTNAILFQQTSLAGNVALYSFLWKWKNTVTALTQAAVKVVATDAAGNQSQLEVNVSLDH